MYQFKNGHDHVDTPIRLAVLVGIENIVPVATPTSLLRMIHSKAGGESYSKQNLLYLLQHLETVGFIRNHPLSKKLKAECKSPHSRRYYTLTRKGEDYLNLMEALLKERTPYSGIQWGAMGPNKSLGTPAAPMPNKSNHYTIPS